MPELTQIGHGVYTFGDAAALKEFLLIDGKCLAKAQKKRCQNPKAAGKDMNKKLDEVVVKGFPSTYAASTLREIARECICNTKPKHLDIVSGYGEDVKATPQHVHLYNEWNRKLWVAYLKKNGVFWVRVDEQAPSLEDPVEKWTKEVNVLKALPTLGSSVRDTEPGKDPVQVDAPEPKPSSSTVDPSRGHGRSRKFGHKRAFTAPITMFGLKEASTTLRTMPRLKREPTAPRSSGEGRGLGAMFRKIFGFSRPADPAQPTPESRDETRVTSTAGVDLAERSRREPLERFEPVLEDDSKPRDVGTETQTSDRFTTPSKRRNSSGDLLRGMPGAFDQYDTSPALSSQTDAPSPLFSIHNSDLGGTPDTTHSREFDFDTTGKGPCTREDGTSDPDDPVDSKMFNSTASRAAAGAANNWMRPLKPNPTTGSPTDVEPESGSGKRPPRATGHQLDTPTKTRTAPRDVAPGPDGDGEQLGARHTHPHFKPKSLNQFDALRKLLGRLGAGIEPIDMKEGYIYIYKRNTAPGFLKIGRSQYASGTRMKQISYTCGFGDETTLVYEKKIEAFLVMEKCVHDHLDACHYWDTRCAMTSKGKKGTGLGQRKKLCTENHTEWFRTSEEKAKEVFKFWMRFIDTAPYENGRLNSFWRNELVVMWDKLPLWEKEESPALARWDCEMQGALGRWGAWSKGNPTADLPLRLVARCEGEGSVLDVFDETSGKPLLTVPMRPKRERV